MAGFTAPNYTQTPNIFFDEMMAQMGEAELRVALVIMRETFGWHREGKVMSLSYLQKATGMSRQGVKNGIDAGLERGVFWRKAADDSFEYGLVVNEVDYPSQQSRPEVVNEVDTTNKDTNKEEERNTPPPRQLQRQTPRHRQTPEHMRIATTFGLEPRDMTRLVNAILDATGKRALADTEGTLGERELSYAQECAVTLLQLGVHSPEGVMGLLKAFRDEYPKFSSPSYRQLGDIASKRQAKPQAARVPANSTRNPDGSVTVNFVPKLEIAA